MSSTPPTSVPILEEIITRDALIVTPDTSLGETIELLNRREENRDVLVREKGRLFGIVPEKEILKAIATDRDWREIPIGEITDRAIVTLTYTGTENALSAWDLARRNGVSRLPVVDEEGELLGIVTAETLLQSIDPVAFAGAMDDRHDRQVLESIAREIRSLYENVSCGYHCLDAEGFIVEMNDTELKSLGYNREEVIGRRITDFLPPEGRESFDRNFSLFKERGWINNIDHPIYRKDGSILFQNLSAEAVYDDAGNFLLSRAVVIDVTEYKRLERALRDSEARLHGILNSRIVAIATFRVFADRDWEYEYYSAGCEALFGYTADEFLADKTLWISSVIPLEGDNLFDRLFEAFFAEQSTTAEYRFCRKDGSIRWFYSTFTSHKGDGDYWTITMVNTDITDRVEAETKLRESEQLLSLAVKCARAGSWSWKIATGELVWSPETYRLYGLDPDEGFPVYENWYNDLLHPDDRARLNEYITRTIERRLPDIGIEFRVLHPRLGVRWLLSLGRLILNERGEPTRVSGLNIDITDRVEAETKLRESEEFLRGIYEGANQAIFVIDVTENGDFRYLDFNPVSERYGGVRNRDIRGKTPEEVYGMEIGTAFRQNYDRCLREGTSVTYEERAVLEGREIWALTSLSPLHDDRGKIARIVGTSIDITDRIRAENALRESELRYANLAEASPVAIFRFDTNAQCVYVNRRWCEMTGRSAESGLGTGWVETIHPDVRDSTRQAWEKWLSGDRQKPFQNESYKIRPDGSILQYYCQIVAETDENGAIIGYVGSLTDISDRVEAELALRESERKLQSILDHSPAAIYVTDRENKILLANRRYAELLSTTVDALIGKSIHESWPAEIAATFAENNQKVWESGRLVQSEEVAPHPDGLHTYLTVKFPLLDGDGDPYAVCGISTDITEKKRLEEQFYRAERLESLGTLASGIAHDLNNVFTPILAITRILSSESPEVNESTRQLLEVLENSARQGAEMIREILRFSRGGEGNRVTVSPLPLLSEVLRVVRKTFPKNLRISFSRPEGEVWPVSADPTRLQQVVMNLLVNARDAMPDGGKLTLRVRNARIDERFARVNPDARPGAYVAIAVSDTGTGISPDKIDRVFDPFFTTKKPGEGTGLGLSSVLGIVRNHGGFVRVSSRVGKGSRLTVYLPALSGENFLSPQAGDRPADEFRAENRLTHEIIEPEGEYPLDRARFLGRDQRDHR